MQKLWCCLLCVSGLAAPAAAEVVTYSAASTAGHIFAIPAGARPAGLGGAFSAVRGDINSAYWNPAGLLGVPEHRVQASHQAWIQEINSEYLLYAQPVEGFGAAGVGIHYVNYGGIERWNMDDSGNPIPTGAVYTPFALAGRVNLAVPAGPGWALGAALKLAYEQIDSSGALAGGLDVGVQYTPLRDLNLGAVLRNIGLAAGEKLLPLTLALGAAYDLPYSFTENDLLTLLLDIDFRHDDAPTAGLGLEYTYINLFQVRAGWNPDFGRTIAGRLGLTVGAGLVYQNWNLDYAFAPQGDLGASHQVSLQYGF